MQTTETTEQELTNEAGARGAPTPRERLAAYSARIGECQQQMKRTLPAAVELGRCAIQVRDEGLLDLVGKRDIYVWMYEVHGIRTTQAKTLLRVGEAFTPERVEGRDVTLDCLHQITRAPVALRPLLIDLAEAERIRGVGLMRRCCAEAAAVYGGPGDEERAMRAARAVLSGPAPLSEQARVQAAMGRVERVVGKLEEASDPALLDEVVQRLSVLLEQVKALRGETIETAEARPEVASGLGPSGSSSSSSSSSSRGPEPEAPPQGESQAGQRKKEESREVVPVSGLTPLMQRIWEGSADRMPAPQDREEVVRRLREIDQYLAGGREMSAGYAAVELLNLVRGPSPLWVCCSVLVCLVDFMGLSPGSVRKEMSQILKTCAENPGWDLGRILGLARHLYGAALVEARKYREAVPVLQQAIEIYEREPDVPARHMMDLLLRLNAALKMQGYEVEAEALWARFEAERERAGGFDGMVVEEEEFLALDEDDDGE